MSSFIFSVLGRHKEMTNLNVNRFNLLPAINKQARPGAFYLRGVIYSLPSGKLKDYLGKRKKIRKALTPVPNPSVCQMYIPLMSSTYVAGHFVYEVQ